MDGWFLIGIVLFAWFVFAPILGVLGFSKASRLERELQALRRGQATGDAVQPKPANGSVTAPQQVPSQSVPQSAFESEPLSEPLKPTPIPVRAAPSSPSPSLHSSSSFTKACRSQGGKASAQCGRLGAVDCGQLDDLGWRINRGDRRIIVGTLRLGSWIIE